MGRDRDHGEGWQSWQGYMGCTARDYRLSEETLRGHRKELWGYEHHRRGLQGLWGPQGATEEVPGGD